MRENGTDRDVALMIISNLQNINANLEDINNNLYAVYIHTQPTNQEVSINDYGTFSVVASNVVSYQWQYKAGGVGDWIDVDSTSFPTAITSDFRFYVNSSGIYLRTYRCKMVGKDGQTVYTNVVQITEPAGG